MASRTKKVTLCELIRRTQLVSCADLAKLAGVPVGRINCIERGEIVSDYDVQSVAIALGFLGNPRMLDKTVEWTNDMKARLGHA